MGLETFIVRRKKVGAGRAKNYNSESQGYQTENIEQVIPSICTKDGISDGLVNSYVKLRTGSGELIQIWCTQTVATIVALDD